MTKNRSSMMTQFLKALACKKALIIWLTLATVLIAIAATTPTDDQISDAIYMAEGGAGNIFPYGIMKHYRHTTTRQACLNTIAHCRRDFIAAGGPGDFISYLAARYAPLNCDNDPLGLNKHWKKNVLWFLAHLELQK